MRVFEDFVPVSDTEALITAGDSLTELTQIRLVLYSVDALGRVHVDTRNPLGILAEGGHLRLGHMLDGKVLYSDQGVGIFHGGRQVDGPPGAHQPFVHRDSLYYTDDWPCVTIHKDGRRYLDHWAAMLQVGNPHWHEDVMYFEARDTVDGRAVDRWQVWAVSKGEHPTLVTSGANPAVYAGKLFVGRWTGKRFDYHVAGRA